MTASDVTCAWCHRTTNIGEHHGAGHCTVTVETTNDTTHLTTALNHLAQLIAPAALAAAIERERTLAQLSALLGRAVALDEHGGVSLTADEIERLKDQMPPATPPAARPELHWLDGIPIHTNGSTK